MNIGITVGVGARSETTIDGLAARLQQLEQMGFRSAWMPTAFGLDAITALAAAGRGLSRIEIGTAVVPTFPRHPVAMAQQALTAQMALSGRFTLGIGLSHKVMMEDQLGIAYDKPARHMREYLTVLAPLLRNEAVSHTGDAYRVNTSVTVPDTAPVPLLVAAMGPVMLKLAGTLADGTITSWVGPRTLAEHIVPAITTAAREAGRPAPRIVAGLPIALTDDAPAARAQVGTQTAWYDTLPSYKAMLDREGVSGPGDVALVGNAAELDAALARLADAGVTDFAAQIVSTGPGTPARTAEYLATKL